MHAPESTKRTSAAPPEGYRRSASGPPRPGRAPGASAESAEAQASGPLSRAVSRRDGPGGLKCPSCAMPGSASKATGAAAQKPQQFRAQPAETQRASDSQLARGLSARALLILWRLRRHEANRMRWLLAHGADGRPHRGGYFAGGHDPGVQALHAEQRPQVVLAEHRVAALARAREGDLD